MKPTRAALLFAVAFFLFLAANRAAYKGFFSGDDLDNIAWTRELPLGDYATGLLTPRYHLNHFRPVGHGTFAILGRLAGMRYEWYAGVLHLLHLATTLVLYGLLCRLGFQPLPAVVGACFFLFQMALFPALWKPMYLFDVWCGLFAAATLHAWIRGRIAFAMAFLWLAIKSKEHAVMIVPVLVLYELWSGERRWKRLLAASLIAAVFVAQALVENQDQGKAYRMSFHIDSLIQTASFYGSRVLLWPYLGLLLIPGAAWAADRRGWWGLASGLLLLLPMLFLPGRMFAAYLYVPMLGIAILIAALAARADRRVTAVVSVLWLAINFLHLRQQRREELAIAAQSRGYFEEAVSLARREPDLRKFVYAGTPEGLQSWGVEGALRLAYGRLDLEVAAADSRELDRLFGRGPVGVLSWNSAKQTVTTEVRRGAEKNSSYIDVGTSLPLWQFGEGWYDPEGAYRWIKPRATATLHRPGGTRTFELRVNVGEVFISQVKTSMVSVRIDGVTVGTLRFSSPGWNTAKLDLGPGPEADVTIEFRAAPEFKPANDPRSLGIAIGAFGFR